MTPRVQRYISEIVVWHGVEPSELFRHRAKGKSMLAAVDVMRRLQRDGFTSAQIGQWMKREASTVRHNLRNHPERP